MHDPDGVSEGDLRDSATRCATGPVLFCFAAAVPAGFDSERVGGSSASFADCSVLHRVQSHEQLFCAIEYLQRAAHLQLSPTTNGQAGSLPASWQATPHELCRRREMLGRHSSGTKAVT